MSWAEEDWTVGLSGRVLQKVKELQVHHERLSRENKQKQLQLDNIHTSLEKQVVKYEDVRGELQSVQRDLQSVREEAKVAVISRERLTQDLQTKQAQVCSLEGQLDATRTLNSKLTQEVKKLEAELEKLQNTNRLADTTLFSTPCWSTTSPWEQNGSRKDEERLHQDETQNQAPHVRQRLQFSDIPTNSLPRQHKSTPHHRFSDPLESFSTPLAVFPWERDDTRQTARRRSPSSPQAPCTDVISQGQSALGHLGKDKDKKTEMDTSLSEVHSRVSCLEEELSVKAKTITSLQSDLVQNKKELAAQELSLQKARGELSLAHTRISQESERASGAEQRLKQLQEELKCQRQNAESSRLQHQQRSKELEKQHQRDVTELQKERQWLEKQHKQEVNKFNQELQHARSLHNALQAQADKLSLQKQVVDKDLDMLKEKLKWMEGQLQESQKKEAQTQAKLTEALREAEGVAVSLEQSRKRERGLEEEGRRLAEERADTLRLLKDLQEQIAAPAPPLQPVQFCPVGQSYPPHPSQALQSRQITRTKKPSTTVKKEDEDVYERGAELSAPYPSEREPGEGIDSEYISTDSEGVQREGHRRKNNGENNNFRNEKIECDSSGTKGNATFGHVHSSVSHSSPDMYTNTSVDAYNCNEKPSDYGTPSVKPEQTKASEDLQRENVMLRSEINDVREELQKRLEDLEAQRRAEAEARTRLKQLSRKHASQAVEKVEQEKEWRAKLESERAEVDKLRKAIVGLETEVKSRKKEREEQEKERNKALEDGESEMIELNIQLKKQLADVKAQLALEREERRREDEERSQTSNLDADINKELSTKLAELQAEIEELKCSKKEDERAGEEKLLLAHSPLTYLSFHDDELNSNIGHCDNKFLLSPEQHLLCQSTNQLNTLVSQGKATLTQKQSVSGPESSPLSGEGQTYRIPSDVEDTRQNSRGGTFVSDPRNDISHLQKCESAPSHLEKEVVRLQKEKAKETERANQNQVKLEALQSQVTRQTQQLTMAFEKQSQHISGLLAELHEKEIALLRQGEEMQRCKQELDVLQAEKEAKKGQREGRLDVKLISPTVQQPKEESDCAATCDSTNVGSTAQRDENQTESDATTPTHVSSKEDNEALFDTEKTGGNHGSICGREETVHSQDDGAAHDARELLNQRIESLTVSDTGDQALHTDTEGKEDPVKQSSGYAVVSCSTEEGPSSEENDITAEGQESLLQNERREDGDLEREDKMTRAERASEEVSRLQIKHLEQQVVALQVKLRALSEETRQQNEELALWRLASQPAPALVQLLPNENNHSQISAISQALSNRQHTEETTHDPAGTKNEALADQIPVIQKSPSNVAVIREDELLLSCSSNKLQGQMLFSRLQHSNFPEPKSAQYCKKSPAPKEHNLDTVNFDKECEKENQEGKVLQCQDEHDTEVILTSEKTGQRVCKGPTNTKTECHSENPVAKPKVSRASNDTNTSSDALKRAIRTETKSVSSQTEESVYPHGAPTTSKLHCAYTQTEEADVDLEDSPSVSPGHLAEGAESREKMIFSGAFPIPADPARLAERIRRNRTQLSAAFDDTEYEPYGLPEVVMKGFADIPSGPSCPYIVRRGLLGTSVVPVPQKDTVKEEETD